MSLTLSRFNERYIGIRMSLTLVRYNDSVGDVRTSLTLSSNNESESLQIISRYYKNITLKLSP